MTTKSTLEKNFELFEYVNKQIKDQIEPLQQKIAELEKYIAETNSNQPQTKKQQQDSYSFNPIAKFKFLSVIDNDNLNQLKNKQHSELYRIFATIIITLSVNNFNDLTNTASLNELLIKNTSKLLEALKVQLPVHEEIELCQTCSQLAKQIQSTVNTITLMTPTFNNFVNTVEKQLIDQPGVSVDNLVKYTKSIKFPNQYKFILDHTELYNQQSSKKQKSNFK